MPELPYLLIISALIGANIYQFVSFSQDRKDMLDRLMAKDLEEFKRETAKEEPTQPQKLDTTQDLEDSYVDIDEVIDGKQ